MIFIDLYIILMEINAKVNTDGSLFGFFEGENMYDPFLAREILKKSKNPKKSAKTLKKGIDKEGEMW